MSPKIGKRRNWSKILIKSHSTVCLDQIRYDHTLEHCKDQSILSLNVFVFQDGQYENEKATDTIKRIAAKIAKMVMNKVIDWLKSN